MSIDSKDPLGQAILEYSSTQINRDIIVLSDVCEDDIIPSEYLFRSYDEMPEIEKLALSHVTGNILDVGAGAGIHAKYLQSKGFSVDCLDASLGSIEYLTDQGYHTIHSSFQDYSGNKYDTILMLMNGIGLAGQLDNLSPFLMHAKSLLKPGGIILCDSTDIQYLYENEDGSVWVDLNQTYYGNVQFQMKYKQTTSDWFDWLYVDFNNLAKVSEECGLKASILLNEGESYLAKITL